MSRESRVYYQPGTRNDAVSLDGFDAYIDYGDGMRSHSWSRTITSKSIRGLTLNSREIDVTVRLTDEKANELRRVADADVSAKLPGTIIVDGEWKMRCYIVASKTKEVYWDWLELSLTLALVDSYWWRRKKQHFVAGLTEDGLDYPHDHEYDFSFQIGEGRITVDSLIGALPLVRFYGPCTNPYVTIGGNRYEVDANVPSGSTATIDATTAKPTVVLSDAFGNKQSIFALAVRDGGLNGGSYAFQPLPGGALTVTWSGSFAFDVEWVEKDTEPPWER